MYLLDHPLHKCEDYITILTYIDTYGKIVVQRKEIKRSKIEDKLINRSSKIFQVGAKLWLFGKLLD